MIGAFEIDPNLQYLGDHEKLDSPLAVEIEFLHVLRNAAFDRSEVIIDTFNHQPAFSSTMSEILLARAAMMNHPVSQHLKSVLILSDNELREANE